MLLCVGYWNSPDIFKITSNKQTIKYKNVNVKLTVLLALTSVSRCSKIKHLDIRFYTKYERKFYFSVIKPTKT